MQTLEKFNINPLEYFIGKQSYSMKPKPIQGKGFLGKIRGWLDREYELVSNLDWHSDDGEAVEAILLAFHQINAEEEKRIQKEWNDKNKNPKT